MTLVTRINHLPTKTDVFRPLLCIPRRNPDRSRLLYT